MRDNIELKISLKNLLESILAFVLVLECNTVYSRFAKLDLHFDWMCIVFAFILLMITKGISKKSVRYTGAFFCAIVFYMIITFYKINTILYVYLMCLFFPMLLLYLMDKKNEDEILSIYDKFSVIVECLAVTSTFVWFFAEIIGVLSPNMSIDVAWGGEHTVKGIFGLYFECQLENTFGLYVYRNSGIFCEAPMFSLVLSLALFYELFLRGEFKKNRVLILIISIITTLTSTGFLILILSFGLVYWGRAKQQKKSLKIMYALGMIIILLVSYYLLTMILDAKSSRGSYITRTVDYIIGIQAFLKNPLTGSGFGSLSQLVVNKASLLASYGMRSNGEVGYSNSLTAVIGQGGLYISILYFFPFINLLIKGRNQTRNYRAWVIEFLVLFSLTIFYAKMITIYFLAIAYVLGTKIKSREIY